MKIVQPQTTLKHLLEEAKIFSKQDFEEKRHLLPLETLSKQKIGVDGENRLYDDEINYSNCIINTSILLKNTKRVNFMDCIVDDNLSIQALTSSISISLSHCVVLGSIVIDSFDHDTEIDIHAVNCVKFVLRGDNFKKINIGSLSTASILFEAINGEYINVSASKIGYVEILDVYFKDINFQHTQIEKKFFKNIENKKYKEFVISNFNCFDYAHYTIERDIKIISDSQFEQTFDFVVKKLGADKNKEYMLDCLYSLNTRYRKAFLNNVIVIASKNFSSPFIFFLYSIISIVIFAIIFYSKYSSFINNLGEKITLTLSDSLYYSMANFTTLVYGDIIPKTQITRFFAVFESFIGIFFISCFVVALVRRYIERVE